MNAFLYLVRRETWEHKALYRAPIITMLVLATVAVLLTARGLIGGDLQMFLDGEEIRIYEHLPEYLSTVSPVMIWPLYGVIITVSMLTAIFYLLDCLYAERKNHSIMFWKSLPISDTATVLSKLVAAMVFLPLVAIVSVLAGWLFLQILGATIFLFLGINGLPLLWQPGTLFNGLLLTLEASTGLLLWYLPLAGWLMLVSAWAKRSALMWAVFPPFTVIFLEGLFFNTREFASLLHDRFVGFHTMVMDMSDEFPIEMHDGPPAFLSSSLGDVIQLSTLFREPGLYGGFVVAAIFVTGAIFLRRYRNEA